ncbi:molybdopterin-guanine dinucleotide biosynthesis protein A [Algoriphagus alkaliphilus]|uniref:Probable molybdenum cofactor guanylyltransferase n=1 Tax=Algoriphagus alkaliphilus TaxID=279824 RepID=A0A1G5VSQ4_9BACT|nr:molybdenum cofactor guanylyltransferase [Algoriphagus alkaliphilus]MBA4298537.1 molybdenum cofactor guanylyltransferase [Cyclobacterium sp.]SDA48426.1 molybdopterin-guanine dinucleotide biosynthesis protein A [Algoriphagus alkaliphilus]
MKALNIYILAGGKSSRMEQEKGLVEIFGKPMVRHLLEKVTGFGLPITIIAHHQDYKQFDVPVIKDIIPEKGPMGGLYTALIHSIPSSPILLLSCDMPFLSLEVLQRFISQSDENQMLITELHGKIMPFPGIYPAYLLPSLRLHIQENKLKFQHFIHNSPHLKLNLDKDFLQNPESFQNINTLQDKENAMTWQNKKL